MGHKQTQITLFQSSHLELASGIDSLVGINSSGAVCGLDRDPDNGALAGPGTEDALGGGVLGSASAGADCCASGGMGSGLMVRGEGTVDRVSIVSVSVSTVESVAGSAAREASLFIGEALSLLSPAELLVALSDAGGDPGLDKVSVTGSGDAG